MELNQVRNEYDRGNYYEFLFFWGHTPKLKDKIDKSCLSQWFAGYPFIDHQNVEFIEFPTAEHYMMHHKAKVFNDKKTASKILDNPSPGEAKKLGRQVSGFNKRVWENHVLPIIFRANFFKFSQHTELYDFLISTGDKILVEASPYDKIYGVGMSESDSRIHNPHNWLGLNWLGFTLTDVRDYLINKKHQ